MENIYIKQSRNFTWRGIPGKTIIDDWNDNTTIHSHKFYWGENIWTELEINELEIQLISGEKLRPKQCWFNTKYVDSYFILMIC